jgi:flagellar biosynthesis protein FlhG
MNDQAVRLRNIAKRKPAPQLLRGRTIAITSGKGGVGKTNIATNLAILLCKYNKKTLLMDVDLGLANVDVLLGIHPEYTLQHVITGDKEIKDIILKGPEGLMIVPASSGVEELANLTSLQRERLINSLSQLDDEVDIVIVDTAAGISSNVLSFVLAANEILIVTTPEPTAITDAYAMIKVIANYRKDVDIKLIVNMYKGREEADRTARKIIEVAKLFLNIEVQNLGFLPLDPNVPQSTRHQRPFVLEFPNSSASSCLNDLAALLVNNTIEEPKLGIKNYFQRVTETLASVLV